MYIEERIKELEDEIVLIKKSLAENERLTWMETQFMRLVNFLNKYEQHMAFETRVELQEIIKDAIHLPREIRKGGC